MADLETIDVKRHSKVRARVDVLRDGGLKIASEYRTYNMLAAFTWSDTNYPAVTIDQLAALSSSDYYLRSEAFKSYISNMYSSNYTITWENSASVIDPSGFCAIGNPGVKPTSVKLTPASDTWRLKVDSVQKVNVTNWTPAGTTFRSADLVSVIISTNGSDVKNNLVMYYSGTSENSTNELSFYWESPDWGTPGASLTITVRFGENANSTFTVTLS